MSWTSVSNSCVIVDRGWYEVRLRNARIQDGEQARLWLDFGRGFSAFHCLDMWQDGDDFAAVMRFHRPVREARLDRSRGPRRVPAAGAALPEFRRISALSLTLHRLIEALAIPRALLKTASVKDRLAPNYLRFRRFFSFPPGHRILSSYEEWRWRNEALRIAPTADDLSLTLLLVPEPFTAGDGVRAEQIISILPQLLPGDGIVLPNGLEPDCVRCDQVEVFRYDPTIPASVKDLLPADRKFDRIVLVRGGACLHIDAVARIRAEAQANANTDVMYAGSDRVDEHRRRREPTIRSCTSFDREFNRELPGLVLVSRPWVLQSAPGRILTGLFTGAPPLHIAAIDAVPAYRTIGASSHRCTSAYRPSPSSKSPTVSIIVPTKDRDDLLRRAIASIKACSYAGRIETIIVDHGSTSPSMRTYLEELVAGDPSTIIVPYAGDFNFSAKCNKAASVASNDLLLFLNNDVTFEDSHSIEALATIARRNSVGCVGGLLCYPDGRIQHAGIVLGIGGIAGNAARGCRMNDGIVQNWICGPRNVSAVTGACLMIDRKLFIQLGGFDQINLPVAFSDVDLCLRAARAGRQNVWTPHARLIHAESASRDPDDFAGGTGRFASEYRYMRERWGEILDNDPWYSPTLTLHEPGLSPRL